MVTKGKISTIFPACEDEKRDLEPIIFHVPATYNNKVKIDGWHMNTLEEPKDNKEFFPPKGNLHVSSYKRIGPEDACTGVSETTAMLAQIELKDLYKPIVPQRTLRKMRTLAATGVEEEKQPTLIDLLYDSEEATRMDYRTTTEVHYRSPYPMKPRPLPPSPPPVPWLLNRRTIGYSLEELEKRDGVNKFLDDNMDLHHQIAELKSRRYKLHEILRN
ncbi:uncharacterized protein LOC100881159 [Megachile rotundata]|uniref:uncharacterized protein LOC100881159 n=1 Tax=Megachile rotundata TaxID=143995 RepID=UPI000614BA62|nr:PREDICTED: uncharacterized protein LOC100881159 [Megachile rotundata]